MSLPNIAPDVWASRPILKDVRDAAHQRTASADAVLWSLLPSAAAFIPSHVAIDTGIGVPVRPTLFSVLAGPSGSGKSSAWGVARALYPNTPEPLPLSTGEGLIESFYGRVPVEQPQPDGKPPKIVWARRRVRNNALFWLDEGETLFRQTERAGNVIGPVLRSFWSGGTVGQANASEELRRGLDAGTYTGGLVLGLQPGISGKLLTDTATGTAQRFVWCATTDRYLTDAGTQAGPLMPISWQPPPLPSYPGEPGDRVAAFLEQPSPEQPFVLPEPPPPVAMTLDSTIAAGIRAHQVAIRRGDVEPDEQDTQRTAMQVKVAGVLAWLDTRLAIEAEDWQLAEALLGTSDEVRAALIEHAEMVTATERAEKGVERAQVARAESRAQQTRDRCQERVVSMIESTEAGVTHGELNRAMTKGQRAYLAEVLREQIDAGALVVETANSGGHRYRAVVDGE